jgi:hypothetical protein
MTDFADPATQPHERGRSRRVKTLVAALLLAIGGVAAYVVARHDLTPTRQEVIADRGALVMPFDLNATRHQFETTGTGAVETVTANSADDTTQINLIRQHLVSEATRFQTGDYGDPAAIHGANMPGLAALKQSRGRVAVTYVERPAGATITFSTTDPELRAALADWVMAQNMDHGTEMNHGS